MYLVTTSLETCIILYMQTHTLHTPMYFFLCNLSLVDIFLSSTTVPKMLVNLWNQSKAIPFAGCTQIRLPPVWDHGQLSLLAMAMIGSLAIVHPLLLLGHHESPRVCGLLVVGWLITNLQSIVHQPHGSVDLLAGSEIPTSSVTSCPC